MSGYLTSITPDSFSGIIFALEGISRSAVLLNGPTGCKFYHSSISDNQMIRQKEFDPLNFPEKWYFGQPRVPCTYLDNDDYIYGSMDKLEEALEYIRDNFRYEILCLVNSPGAALIGDDLEGISKRIVTNKPVLTLETPGYSSDVCKGYETAALRLIEKLPLVRTLESAGAAAPRSPDRSVNILGLSLYHRNCTGDALELRRLMGLCGIEVNCTLFADSDLRSIMGIPKAGLNIVIHPEYALETARLLKERFGTPYYICSGPPIGFSATEAFVDGICNELDADNTRFIEDSERARARAYPFISRVNSLTGLPKGVSFAVEGTYSELYAYTSFLVRYFGMIPECAAVLSPSCDAFRDELHDLYKEFGFEDALERDILDTSAELVFASGNTIAGLKLRKHIFTGIETALPTLGYVDVIPKTHLGVQGALTIVEQVLNGMVY